MTEIRISSERLGTRESSKPPKIRTAIRTHPFHQKYLVKLRKNAFKARFSHSVTILAILAKSTKFKRSTWGLIFEQITQNENGNEPVLFSAKVSGEVTRVLLKQETLAPASTPKTRISWNFDPGTQNSIMKCVSHDKIQLWKVARCKNDIRASESQDFGGFWRRIPPLRGREGNTW